MKIKILLLSFLCFLSSCEMTFFDNSFSNVNRNQTEISILFRNNIIELKTINLIKHTSYVENYNFNESVYSTYYLKFDNDTGKLTICTTYLTDSCNTKQPQEYFKRNEDRLLSNNRFSKDFKHSVINLNQNIVYITKYNYGFYMSSCRKDEAFYIELSNVKDESLKKMIIDSIKIKS